MGFYPTMPDNNQQQDITQGGARGLAPPQHLTVDDRVGSTWPIWKQQYNLYAIATGLQQQPKQIQSTCSTLLHVLGVDALVIYNSFDFGEEDKGEPKILIKHFDNHFLPKKNITFERHVFNARSQQPGETFDHFVTDLKNKANTL